MSAPGEMSEIGDLGKIQLGSIELLCMKGWLQGLATGSSFGGCSLEERKPFVYIYYT